MRYVLDAINRRLYGDEEFKPSARELERRALLARWLKLSQKSSQRAQHKNIMSVLVRIPTPLQKLVGDRAEVSVEATDLRGAVNELASQSDEFKTRMLDDKGELRRFVNVYVNEEDVRFLQKLDTPLKDGDEVSIVPAIAGGQI